MTENESASKSESEPEHEHDLRPSHVAMDVDGTGEIWFFVRYICIGNCDFETFVAIEGEEI